MVKRSPKDAPLVRQQARYAARTALLAELGRLRSEDRLSRSAAVNRLVSLCAERPEWSKLALVATGKKSTKSGLARATVYTWLQAVNRGGLGELAPKIVTRQQPLPWWLPGFLNVLRPTVPSAYAFWIERGAAPNPPPSLIEVRRALRRKRMPGR